MEQLLEGCLGIPGVYSKQSRMAVPGSTALFLSDEYALGPSDAFIDGHEFCHIHPQGEIHLTLPSILGAQVIRLGWGERHPVAETSILPNLITVYAPRDGRELAAVLRLIDLSCQFAQGQLPIVRADQQRARVAQ